MTKEVVVRLRDDLTKKLGNDIQTYTFRHPDGKEYELELSAKSYKQLIEALKPFVDAGRPVKRKYVKKAKEGGPQSRPKSKYTPRESTVRNNAVRAWARENGWADLGNVGKIPSDAQAAFESSAEFEVVV